MFTASAPGQFEPGRRVLVRTSRGVELGQVAAPAPTRSDEPAIDAAASDGQAAAASIAILRGTTAEDELLIRRLEKHKRRAVESCREALLEAGSASTLLDVDQLFDGGTLLLHFLGPVDPVAQQVTQSVVERYESIVRSREFAKLLSVGCGPGCGTDQGGGCSGSCAGCAVASACKTG